MDYRCWKCGIACCNKAVRKHHEEDCNDTLWSQRRQTMGLYDHNYTNCVIPDMTRTRYSNGYHITDVEHNYCFTNPYFEGKALT